MHGVCEFLNLKDSISCLLVCKKYQTFIDFKYLLYRDFKINGFSIAHDICEIEQQSYLEYYKKTYEPYENQRMKINELIETNKIENYLLAIPLMIKEVNKGCLRILANIANVYQHLYTTVLLNDEIFQYKCYKYVELAIKTTPKKELKNYFANFGSLFAIKNDFEKATWCFEQGLHLYDINCFHTAADTSHIFTKNEFFNYCDTALEKFPLNHATILYGKSFHKDITRKDVIEILICAFELLNEHATIRLKVDILADLCSYLGIKKQYKSEIYYGQILVNEVITNKEFSNKEIMKLCGGLAKALIITKKYNAAHNLLNQLIPRLEPIEKIIAIRFFVEYILRFGDFDEIRKLNLQDFPDLLCLILFTDKNYEAASRTIPKKMEVKEEFLQDLFSKSEMDLFSRPYFRHIRYILRSKQILGISIDDEIKILQENETKSNLLELALIFKDLNLFEKAQELNGEDYDYNFTFLQFRF